MSKLNIKQAFLSHLLSNLPTGITANDIAFENKKFKPKNKDAWLAVYMPANDKDPLGKTSSDFDDNRGFYQISVFIPINSNDFDNTQLQIIDELEQAFSYNTELVYNGQKVYITESQTTAGTESEAWFQRDLTLNYFSLSERG